MIITGCDYDMVAMYGNTVCSYVANYIAMYVIYKIRLYNCMQHIYVANYLILHTAELNHCGMTLSR